MGDRELRSCMDSFSPEFVAELKSVFDALQPRPFSHEFILELSGVYSLLPVASDANLDTLAGRFTMWRSRTQDFVRENLEVPSEDDPLRCPVSLYRTMDFGRLETAHTRVLA
jgi:hypothetical protein